MLFRSQSCDHTSTPWSFSHHTYDCSGVRGKYVVVQSANEIDEVSVCSEGAVKSAAVLRASDVRQDGHWQVLGPTVNGASEVLYIAAHHHAGRTIAEEEDEARTSGYVTALTNPLTTSNVFSWWSGVRPLETVGKNVLLVLLKSPSYQVVKIAADRSVSIVSGFSGHSDLDLSLRFIHLRVLFRLIFVGDDFADGGEDILHRLFGLLSVGFIFAHAFSLPALPAPSVS